jgi:hypothetical protein
MLVSGNRPPALAELTDSISAPMDTASKINDLQQQARDGKWGGHSSIWSRSTSHTHFLIPTDQLLICAFVAGFEALINDGAYYFGELVGCFDA